MLHAFERRYLRALMDAAQGNLSAASRQSGVDRKHLRALLHLNRDGPGQLVARPHHKQRDGGRHKLGHGEIARGQRLKGLVVADVEATVTQGVLDGLAELGGLLGEQGALALKGRGQCRGFADDHGVGPGEA